MHEELRVPAEQLDEFNNNIVGAIGRTAAYFGPRFAGHVPERDELVGLDAVSQLRRLAALGDGLHDEVSLNHATVFQHYPFWERGEFPEVADRERVLREVRHAWRDVSPRVPLVAW